MIILKKWVVKNQEAKNKVIAFCEAITHKYAYSFDDDVVTIAIPSKDYEGYITRFMDSI